MLFAIADPTRKAATSIPARRPRPPSGTAVSRSSTCRTPPTSRSRTRTVDSRRGQRRDLQLPRTAFRDRPATSVSVVRETRRSSSTSTRIAVPRASRPWTGCSRWRSGIAANDSCSSPGIRWARSLSTTGRTGDASSSAPRSRRCSPGAWTPRSTIRTSANTWPTATYRRPTPSSGV